MTERSDAAGASENARAAGRHAGRRGVADTWWTRSRKPVRTIPNATRAPGDSGVTAR
jgi:hypothetical protein